MVWLRLVCLWFLIFRVFVIGDGGCGGGVCVWGGGGGGGGGGCGRVFRVMKSGGGLWWEGLWV